MDRSDYSPGLQAKIVDAGVNSPSFEQGSRNLRELADVAVTVKQVERVTQRIGAERCVERDEQVVAYQAKPLVERKDTPAGVTAPEVAAVGVDGGRLQILERTKWGEPVAEEELDDGGNPTKGKHWREDKIGVLLTLESQESTGDPCPKIPATFVDPTKIVRLARELKTKAAASEGGVREAPADATPEAADESERWQPPNVKQRALAATRRSWSAFGPMLAQAAWSLGFDGAKRRAFVSDGAANNWTRWRNHFSSFVPVLDFIHGLS